MPQEIERKFLVDRNHPELKKIITGWGVDIKQGYMLSSERGVIRARVKGDEGYLTIKGANSGISRSEYEYPIPREDAEEILEMMCDKYLSKTRYTFPLLGGLEVEIDVFHQVDLIVAEIELPSEDHPFEKPEWLTEDVSEDPAYFNNAILERISE